MIYLKLFEKYEPTPDEEIIEDCLLEITDIGNYDWELTLSQSPDGDPTKKSIYIFTDIVEEDLIIYCVGTYDEGNLTYNVEYPRNPNWITGFWFKIADQDGLSKVTHNRGINESYKLFKRIIDVFKSSLSKLDKFFFKRPGPIKFYIIMKQINITLPTNDGGTRRTKGSQLSIEIKKQ